jgi:hypothetical protein
VSENLGAQVAANKEREGVFPITLHILVVGESIEPCLPTDTRRDFPFKFQFNGGTETVLCVLASINAKLGWVELNNVTANFQVVG